MSEEIWKAVPGYEGLYEVSDQGRVRSLDRTIVRAGSPARYKGRVLKTAPHNGGYRSVVLSDHGAQTSYLVQDLVMEAHVGPRPPGMWVCHGDNDKTNNYLSNLRYDTPAGNHADKLGHGTLLHGEKHPNARLTREQVVEIREKYRPHLKEALGEEYGVSPHHIYRIHSRERWMHV